MDSLRPVVDLEKELTCSICTELLYHPLTLLDCLHTFCGACLREWFSWQAAAAENAPTPPAPGSPVFTCPSCRAPVRDTRHNATVASLLCMVLTANPEKAKPDSEKEEMEKKYKPGDKVLPDLSFLDRTPSQRRLDEQDRALIEQVRQMSLLEATSGLPGQPRSQRRGGEGRSRNGSARTSRDSSSSRDTMAHNTRAREHRRENRLRAEQTAMLQPEMTNPGERSRTRSRSRQRRDESAERRRRQVEHQSSIRSLISSSDVDAIDMEREIEEFARQIQEEGLLDGLDLDNIDLTNNDELSRKITEAYRRRQRERLRQDTAVRSRASSQHSYSSPTDPRPLLGGSARPSNRQREHSRTPSATSATSQPEDRSRPPISNAQHLDVYEPSRRRRRISRSRDRSATVPAAPTQPEVRVGSRSQTDLDLKSSEGDPRTQRPSISDGRSSSTPVVPASPHNIVESPPSPALPFSARAGGLNILDSPAPTAPELNAGPGPVRRRPADIDVRPSVNFAARPREDSQSSLWPAPLSPGRLKQRLPQLYQEPSIDCNRCGREGIQYELHYNCAVCCHGDWNICLSCYRLGKGCLHWYGFGYRGWHKWERLHKSDSSLPEPHKLLASRFLPPKTASGSGERKKNLTTEDPYDRLQSGTFCALCLAWTNECYWRCDTCNDGDWGFCNDCVNQGRSCTHALLPLAHRPSGQQTPTPPQSPQSSGRQYAASFTAGPHAASIGPFKALTCTTRCNVCRTPILPNQSRYHCFACASAIEPEGQPGDYEICESCYKGLVANKSISVENGPEGWRRCPQGHRMVVVGFREGRMGQMRYTLRDLVGGRKLQAEAAAGDDGDLQRWFWYDGDKKVERLITKDVSAMAAVPTDDVAEHSNPFPPEGGLGWQAVAHWAWYPAEGAYDELLFPRGAEIREIEDVSGEWYHGVCMGAKGLFPAPYVRRVNVEGT